MAKFLIIGRDMEIKLIQFEKNNDPSKPNNLGWALVNLNEKMQMYVSVIQGSKGIFVKLPSTRINGDFRAAVAWHGQNVESKIRDAIVPELEKKLGPTPQQFAAAIPDWL